MNKLLGKVRWIMGSFPNVSFGMGMPSMSDDFYTNQLQQQMMMANYQAMGQGAGAGATNPYAQYYQQQQQVAQQAQGGSKFGVGSALKIGAVAGVGTAAAAKWVNFDFNSPLEAGSKKFSKEFIEAFSPEYANLKNETALKNFYSNIKPIGGVAATDLKITAENFPSLMHDTKALFEGAASGSTEVAASGDLAKFLKECGLSESSAGKFNIDEVRRAYTTQLAEHTNITFMNDLNHLTGIHGSYDDIVKGLESCTTNAEKIEYLKQHHTSFGLNAAELETIHGVNPAEAEINTIVSDIKANKASRVSALKGQIDTITADMQGYASRWDTKVGKFGKGFSKYLPEGQLKALEGALSKMRWQKAGKYGLIAAGVGAGVSAVCSWLA